METERLHFRTWTVADLPLAVALWTDPEVMGHMGGAYTAAEAEARLRMEMAREREFGFQYWPVFSRKTGEHAGCSGLKPYGTDRCVLEVGVHIARPFWSGRYGEEAARAVIRWAFAQTDATALMAGHGPENVASKALIERLGFIYSHETPWGPQNMLHPFYRLERV